MAPVAAIPSGIAGITPRWLTDALHSNGFGGHVVDVRAERIAQDSGFSSLLYRLHLAGDGIPDTLIAKLPAESAARGAMELLGGYRRELAVYRDVAGRAPMGAPRVYVADGAVDSADFVLLLEDLADWHNADHLAGLSMSQARTCIGALAGLHSWKSDAAARQQFPSIDTPIMRNLMVPAFGLGWQVYRENSSASVSGHMQRFAEGFATYAPEALTVLTERDDLLHGDIRADNMFFRGGELKVVDFQFASRGCGAADIAYLVSQGLPSADRRGQDEVLVREYLGQLTGAAYAFDDAWRHYRYAAAYLLMMPVVSLLTWDTVPERSRQLCLTLVDRAVACIEEIDALEVFS